MDRKDIKIGYRYRNIKHDTIETVKGIGKYRKEDGTWVEGVRYEGTDRFTGMKTEFYRTVESFCEDFKIEG